MLNQFRYTLILTLVLFCGTMDSHIYAQRSMEEQLQEAHTKELNPTKKFLRLLRLGDYYKINNITKADSLKDVILEESRNFSDSLRFASLLYNAEVEELTGNREAYFKGVLACQPFLNKVNSDQVQYLIYRHLGNYHREVSEFETADFYLRYSIKIAKKMNSKEGVAKSYNVLALSFMNQNQKDSALYYVDIAIQNARRTTDKSTLASAFNTQAKIYAYFDQIELSVAKNIIALQLATEVNDQWKISQYSREIGESQSLIFNYDDAEYYFEQSLSYANKIHDNRQKALALINLGMISFAKKEYAIAIYKTEQAILLLENVHDDNGLGDAYNNLGIIYREQENFTKASNSFNKALIYFEGIGNKEKIAAVYHNVGTVFHAQKKYANALNYLQRSIEIREQFGSKSQIYHTYRVISDVYKDLGNEDKSLDYLTLYMNYMDSNSSLQAATKIAELSELYRAEQRDRLILSQADSIERQRQEKALTSTKLENIQLRNNFQMYIILGFILIIVLAGIIIFYRWNQTKIMQQQKEAEMSQTLLRAQMNPHFVFNAMSVIQSYIYDNDTENSSRFLVNFSRLMRLILENSPKEEIPIATEQEILEKYLSTQKLRFEDRFDYSIDIEHSLHYEGAMIPPMITQPFIENSIEHGQLHTIEGGFIHVQFRKKGEMLEIVIEDNGVGRKGSEQNKKSKAHKSMAMKITKDRIDNINKKYRTEGFLIVEDYNQELHTGTKVLISLPYRTENQKS